MLSTLFFLIAVYSAWSFLFDSKKNDNHVLSIPINIQPWYSTTHHNEDNDGFRNIWGEEVRPFPLKILGWVTARTFESKEYNNLTTVTKINPNNLSNDSSLVRVTWIGHASNLIQIGGKNILADPVFSERVSPVSFIGPKRRVELPISMDSLPNINTVIISHSHYDHCDKESLVRLNETYHPLFIVPLKLKELLNEWDITNVIELDWWQFIDVDGIRYHCTPARHRSNRGLLDENEILWSSWMIENLTTQKKIYFAGDTGYSSHFSEIYTHLGAPDIAILPIGAYQPRWLMQYVHVEPKQSIQAFLDLKATHFIGMHWGTFDLAEEPFDEPGKIIPEIAKENHIPSSLVHILPIGGSLEL